MNDTPREPRSDGAKRTGDPVTDASAGRRTIGRRDCLRLAGAGLAAGLAGSVPVGATRTDGGTTLDIVEDLGADDTGEEPINDALAEAVEYDSVTVRFPDGEYLIENGPGDDGFARWDYGETEEETQRVGRVALVGDGDATLRPTEGERYPVLTLWGEELSIENFTIDQTRDGTSSGIAAVAENELLVRDIHFDGKVTGPYERTPHYQSDDFDESAVLHDPACLVPGLLNEDGTGVIENVRVPDGIEPYSRKVGCWVNFLHAGDLLIRDCEFSNLSDNGIYASGPGQDTGMGGAVRVEDCHFENTNISAIRLGTSGSYARDCTVITEAEKIPATPWGAITSRAGWIWYDFDGTYENIEVVHDHPSGEGIVEDPSHAGSLEVVDCSFELNCDGATAIRYLDGGDAFAASDVRITGAAGSGSAIALGGCEIDVSGLCLEQTGANRDGISLTNVTGAIEDAAIAVTGEDVLADGASDVDVSGLERGSCSSAE